MSEISEKIDNVVRNLMDLKKNITVLQNELRDIEKQVNRELKNVNRKESKEDKQ